MKNGKFEEALELMKESPDNYGDLYDETRYKVAERAVEAEDYEKATLLLQDNNAREASILLSYVNELNTADEIEFFYNEMQGENSKNNPTKWGPNFDYINGSDFYLRINDMPSETYDMLMRDNKTDNAVENFIEIFGYEPTSLEQTKDDIGRISSDMEFEEFYNSPFHYYQSLYYTMNTLTKKPDFVRFELTDTNGFMIIEQPHEFLQSKNRSAKTFAYLLGTCENVGAQTSRESEKIIVAFQNIQSNSYYSRGYYCCAPNSQHSKIKNFFETLNFSINNWRLDEVGVWADVTVANPDTRNIKYLSIDAVLLVTADGEHIQTASVLLKDTKINDITFTLDFNGITMGDLKEKNISVKFSPAVVMN